MAVAAGSLQRLLTAVHTHTDTHTHKHTPPPSRNCLIKRMQCKPASTRTKAA
jgi:hypothetical protein